MDRQLPDEDSMTESDRIKYPKVALVVIGVTFIFAIYPLTIMGRSCISG